MSLDKLLVSLVSLRTHPIRKTLNRKIFFQLKCIFLVKWFQAIDNSEYFQDGNTRKQNFLNYQVHKIGIRKLVKEIKNQDVVSAPFLNKFYLWDCNFLSSTSVSSATVHWAFASRWNKITNYYIKHTMYI